MGKDVFIETGPLSEGAVGASRSVPRQEDGVWTGNSAHTAAPHKYECGDSSISMLWEKRRTPSPLHQELLVMSK